VLLFGALTAIAATAGGAYLGWENRHAQVRLEAAGHVWTGHLYGVLLAGAVLAAWAMFGLSCIGLWRRERRERRAAAAAQLVDPQPVDPPLGDAVSQRPARRERPVLTTAARR